MGLRWSERSYFPSSKDGFRTYFILGSELTQTLAKQGVQKETREWFNDQGCCMLALFATWVDEVAEMTALARAGPMAKDAAEGPRLKAAYKKAKAVMERRDEREARGLGGGE